MPRCCACSSVDSTVFSPRPSTRRLSSTSPSCRTAASIRMATGRWTLQRGDFRAEWDAGTRRGWIRQTLNPYAIDSVLRIVHTLVLAADGGFLLHASSAVRDGRAVLFTGPSGSGKTTIARLAPPDVTLLTDEIS